MPLKKLDFWDTRSFHDFLLARANMPFEWAKNDCALFAADGALAITGTDIAADFRGKYTDEASAFAAIKSIAGGTSVGDAAAYCATKAAMPERLHPLMAQRGDLVVALSGEQVIAGLIHLSGRYVVAVGEAGLLKLPMSSIKRAWSYE